jgi:hypothetical protein
MIRYRLLETWEPGAVQVCVGDAGRDFANPMRWAKLQEFDQNDPSAAEWRDVPVEPTAPTS